MTTQKEVNTYLDTLRDSGITNMFGARPYVQKAFSLSQEKAGKMLEEWMRTFDERHK